VIGTAQHGKDPLLSADIRKLVAACANNLSGLRDRALILVGFSAASRRSEIAFALVEDLSFCANGVVFNLRKSKADQEAAGRKIPAKLIHSITTSAVCHSRMESCGRSVRRSMLQTGIRCGRLIPAPELSSSSGS